MSHNLLVPTLHNSYVTYVAHYVELRPLLFYGDNSRRTALSFEVLGIIFISRSQFIIKDWIIPDSN